MKLFRKNRKSTESESRSRQRINRRTLVIHHYCPHTFNAGDHFVIRSIRQHLSRLLPEALFIPKACAHNRGWGKPVRLTGRNIAYSNRFADAVVIGGSDQYNNWSLRLRADELRSLVPPLYLIGLGASSKALDQPPHIEDKAYLADIRFANETARLSSVRDDYTRDFLADCGFSGAVVTGCPAMYLFNESFHFKEDGYAALTFPFPVLRRHDPKGYEKVVETVAHLSDFCSDRGIPAVILCHDDRDVNVAQQVFPEARIFFSNYVDDYTDFYRGASLVVGTRLHASIFAASLGKPFININLDARGRAFSQTFGLDDWNVDFDHPELLPEVQDRLNTIIRGDLQPLAAFHARKEAYRGIFTDFMQAVAADIRKTVAPVQA